VESSGVERGLTPVPIEKGRIASLSVGFVENDPFATVVASTQSCLWRVSATACRRPAVALN
jgi:hypothetical protein